MSLGRILLPFIYLRSTCVSTCVCLYVYNTFNKNILISNCIVCIKNYFQCLFGFIAHKFLSAIFFFATKNLCEGCVLNQVSATVQVKWVTQTQELWAFCQSRMTTDSVTIKKNKLEYHQIAHLRTPPRLASKLSIHLGQTIAQHEATNYLSTNEKKIIHKPKKSNSVLVRARYS